MDNKLTTTAQFTAVTLMLTPEAINWLGGITCGVPHLTLYKDLLFGMAVERDTTTKRGIDVPLKAKEVEASANGLAEKWNMSRKVMIRLLNEMQRLGLIKLTSSKLTSIATMSAVTDYLPIDKPVSKPSADESQAEQQMVAQPASGADDGGIAPAFAEALPTETPSASAVAEEVSEGASARVAEATPTDTSNIPLGQPRNPASKTLFDGMDA